MRIKLIFGILLLASTGHLLAQVSPSGFDEHRFPLAVGLAYSNFYTDWNGRISGPALTIDWNSLPIKGLGIEVEARDLNYGRAPGVKRLRFDTAAGGPVYTFRSFRRFQPYGQFLLGFGSFDFSFSPRYTHDTRQIYAPGGGAKYQVSQNVWLRGSYEYQIWPDFLHHHALTPNGFTVGAVYDLRPIRPRTY